MCLKILERGPGVLAACSAGDQPPLISRLSPLCLSSPCALLQPCFKSRCLPLAPWSPRGPLEVWVPPVSPLASLDGVGGSTMCARPTSQGGREQPRSLRGTRGKGASRRTSRWARDSQEAAAEKWAGASSGEKCREKREGCSFHFLSFGKALCAGSKGWGQWDC